jgi:hypothetical protein
VNLSENLIRRASIPNLIENFIGLFRWFAPTWLTEPLHLPARKQACNADGGDEHADPTVEYPCSGSPHDPGQTTGLSSIEEKVPVPYRSGEGKHAQQQKKQSHSDVHLGASFLLNASPPPTMSVLFHRDRSGMARDVLLRFLPAIVVTSLYFRLLTTAIHFFTNPM